MKTFTFTIFGHTFTINLGRKPKEEIKMEEKDPVQGLKEQGLPTAVVAGEEVVGPVTPCFYNACVEYIESQKGKLSDATLRGYQNIANNHLDLLMECYLYDVTEELIQKSFDEEIAKGLSEKTIKGYRSFVTKVLTDYRPDLVLEIRVIPEEK